MTRKTIIDQLWLVEADVTVKHYLNDDDEVRRVHRIVKADSPSDAEQKVAAAYESDDPYGSTYVVEILSTTGVIV